MALKVKLKKLRSKRNVSLQKVADAVGASKAHIWELETGRSSNPSADLLVKLASYFEVSTASLIGEDPSAPDEDPEVIAMFRNLKKLDPRDREVIRHMMKSFKARTGPKDDAD